MTTINKIEENKVQNNLIAVREKMFIAPDGSNKEEFERIMLLAQTMIITILTDCAASFKDEKFPGAVNINNSSEKKDKMKTFFADKKFPEQGKNLEELINQLGDNLYPIIRFGSPSFLGQIHSALNIAAIIGNNIAGLLNANLIAHEVSAPFSEMEKQVVGFLSDLIGYDIEKSAGNIVSGGTIANKTALTVARNKTLPNTHEEGISEALKKYNEKNGTSYHDVAIMSGVNAHYSIGKICGELGIGANKNIMIPNFNDSMDDYYLDIKMQQLKSKGVLPMAVVATAGITDTGNIDNLEDVGEVARYHETYFHVDAALGGGFLVDENMKDQYFQGIEKADSVTIDGHKMLYTDYPCGGIVFKDKTDLSFVKQAVKEAKYIFDKDQNGDEYNHGEGTLEGSRGVSGVTQLWLSSQSLGREGYKDILDSTIKNKKMLCDLLKQDDFFEIINEESPLNILVFRCKPNGLSEQELNILNTKLIKNMHQDGEYYAGSTKIDEKKCFKIVIMNSWTEKIHLEGFIQKIKDLYKQYI